MDANIPTKVTGDTFSALECNIVRDSINSKVDKNYFDNYQSMKNFLLTRPTNDNVIYDCVVISDEKNNAKKPTNYIYINGKLNWVATTPITL